MNRESFNRQGLTVPDLPQVMVDEVVHAALAEDLGRAGDITTGATIPRTVVVQAAVKARSDGVIAGMPLLVAALRIMNTDITIAQSLSDGDRVVAGQAIAAIVGNARAILSAERVALNFLMHLSGVATATARFADRIAHTNARVTCTRKTIPGLRALQKYAVRCGGGVNHRYGLDDAMLIKDNHISVCGGVTAALQAARRHAGHLVRIEVEVDTLDQLREALAADADVILLDNMPLQTLREAVEINAGRAVLEASGNVDIDTIAEIAETGVDYISTSRITMAALPLDIGLDFSD